MKMEGMLLREKLGKWEEIQSKYRTNWVGIRNTDLVGFVRYERDDGSAWHKAARRLCTAKNL